MNSAEALALGQQLGQVLFENADLRARIDRLESILLQNGAAAIAPTDAASPEPVPAAPGVDPMAEFAGLGAQINDFMQQFQPPHPAATNPTPKAAPGGAPPHP